MKQNRTASYAITKTIAGLEGFSSKPYKCPTGYLTIGYGHVIQPLDNVFKELLGFSRVPTNTEISEDLALQILKKDIEIFEEIVNKKCPGLKQQEFDACISFVFNLGGTAFNNSTLARYIDQGFIEEAAEQFSRWVFGKDSSGVPVRLSGLQKRRELERLIFVSGTQSPKIDRTKVTREAASQIELLYSKYAQLLFVEHGIKIELEV